MAAPPSVKRLAADLVAQGIESKYLARVLARVSPDEQMDTLQAEIAREIAQSLGRSEDRVNVALAELELHRARYALAPHRQSVANAGSWSLALASNSAI